MKIVTADTINGILTWNNWKMIEDCCIVLDEDQFINQLNKPFEGIIATALTNKNYKFLKDTYTVKE